ncbi:hypothetical protein RRG08_063396 [Elysia crispata]|uniref:Uncharacterized protein n=1 Tax=Elysia crispata TaxID=231223 RepID=A0AAE1AN46_9GAST|nr:hypothetical protein RRG08_063396 [Elysia crispata]
MLVKLDSDKNAVIDKDSSVRPLTRKMKISLQLDHETMTQLTLMNVTPTTQANIILARFMLVNATFPRTKMEVRKFKSLQATVKN